MPENGSTHEALFVKAFIMKNRQERAIFLLSHPRRRRDFTSELDHFKWLDPRFAIPIPPAQAHTTTELISFLRKKGAKDTVWVISSDESIDGHELGIQEAMKGIWGGDCGTILSCIPGRLCFFRGEEMKSERLLEHP
jgi:hypothetical protein